MFAQKLERKNDRPSVISIEEQLYYNVKQSFTYFPVQEARCFIRL